MHFLIQVNNSKILLWRGEITIELIISAVTQRTGSTLLQRICNARSKTLIWGEHQGVVTHFQRILADTRRCCNYCDHEREDYFGSSEDPNSWIPNLNPEVEYADRAVTTALKSFFRTYYSPHSENHDITGFKEVRYGKKELDLLKKCFPEALFFLLVRHPAAIWKSIPADWPLKQDINKYISVWNTRTRDYLELTDKCENTHLFRFEDIAAGRENTLKKISTLVRVTRENIYNVLAVKLGATRNKNISEMERTQIYEKCRETGARLDYF